LCPLCHTFTDLEEDVEIKPSPDADEAEDADEGVDGDDDSAP